MRKGNGRLSVKGKLEVDCVGRETEKNECEGGGGVGVRDDRKVGS